MTEKTNAQAALEAAVSTLGEMPQTSRVLDRASMFLEWLDSKSSVVTYKPYGHE